jgi:uncharacterized protein
MAASLVVPVADLVANAERIATLELEQYIDAHIGLYTLQDIREELLKPGRDPRQEFVMPHFRADVTTLADLQENMVLEGIVSNVTNFGAFIDIGVHQDGLVHISELSHRYIRDPREVVHVGQIVQVKVLGVDAALQRISLSMKAVQPAASTPPETRQRPSRPPRRKRKKPSTPTPKSEPVITTETAMDEKLRALQAHFHGASRQ